MKFILLLLTLLNSTSKPHPFLFTALSMFLSELLGPPEVTGPVNYQFQELGDLALTLREVVAKPIRILPSLWLDILTRQLL